MATENLKFEIFTCKQHYLYFRQTWKDFINSGKAKPKYYPNPNYENGKDIKGASALTFSHHLLFALLTGKELSKIYTYSPRKGFDSLTEAASEIGRWARVASKIIQWEETSKNPFGQWTKPETMKERLDAYLEPLGITYQMLVKLNELVDVTTIASEFKVQQEAA
jgi:hypothetical protein